MFVTTSKFQPETLMVEFKTVTIHDMTVLLEPQQQAATFKAHQRTNVPMYLFYFQPQGGSAAVSRYRDGKVLEAEVKVCLL